MKEVSDPTNYPHGGLNMGRECRRVPANWQHPKEPNIYNGGERLKPLFSGEDYEERSREFMEMANTKGLQAAIEYCGSAPDKRDYMPNWPESERTHYMMYEDTSEGTPISPAFATPEELARWLADTGASAFGDSTASYEAWLNIARGGWAPSMVIRGNVMMSGVEDSIHQQDRKD